MLAGRSPAQAYWLERRVEASDHHRSPVGTSPVEVVPPVENPSDEQLISFLFRWVGSMNRRELIRLLGFAATSIGGASVFASLDTDERERLAVSVAEPRRIDTQVIGHLESVYEYCRRQDDTFGAQTVLATVQAQQSLLQVPCAARSEPGARQRVFNAVSSRRLHSVE
jgi:hypothetical protein